MSAPENAPRLKLDGLNGWVRGEFYALEQGDITIGRSRSCDISLRRCRGYRDADPQTRDQDHDFNTVSRRHATLSLSGWHLTIRDHSTNGTFYDDHPIDGEQTIDLENYGALVIRLGTRESLIIHRAEDEDTLSTQHRSQPLAEDTQSTEPFDPKTRIPD